jgi:hypothetical protein
MGLVFSLRRNKAPPRPPPGGRDHGATGRRGVVNRAPPSLRASRGGLHSAGARSSRADSPRRQPATSTLGQGLCLPALEHGRTASVHGALGRHKQKQKNVLYNLESRLGTCHIFYFLCCAHRRNEVMYENLMYHFVFVA